MHQRIKHNKTFGLWQEQGPSVQDPTPMWQKGWQSLSLWQGSGITRSLIAWPLFLDVDLWFTTYPLSVKAYDIYIPAKCISLALNSVSFWNYRSRETNCNRNGKQEYDKKDNLLVKASASKESTYVCRFNHRLPMKTYIQEKIHISGTKKESQ